MDTSPHILLVDDDPAIRDTIAECLAAERYRVTACADGRDALARLADGPRPDLVVADLVMPRMNGDELLERMRADPGLREIPVVIMTAAASTPGAAGALPDAVLDKPFELEELLDVVARHSRRGR